MKIDHCYQGDCRAVMRDLIAAGVRVQCIVTSPPYWGLRDYGHAGQLGQEPTLLEFLDNMTEVFDLCRHLLADDGTLWLNMGDSYCSTDKWGGGKGGNTGKQTVANDGSVPSWAVRQRTQPQEGIKPKDLYGQPWRLAFALQDAGWWLRQDIIWHKPNPMPESVRDRCTKAHEYVFLMTKSERYFFDHEASKEEAVSDKPAGNKRHKYADAYATEDSEQHRTKAGLLELAGKEWEARNRRSVWTIPTKPYAGAHFAVFPEELVEPCILAGSRPGDIVFDPFMGSGTVASVAQRLGRRWLGAELNPEYIALQAARTRQPGLMLEVVA